MRHEKAGRLLELARMLAGTAEGLTLDDMAERLGVGRRTAERMRDAVRDVFPQLEEVDDPPTRRFRIPAGLDGLFQAPTAEELAALAAAAETFAQQGAGSRAGALRSLEQKVLSATRAAARRKLAPDLEALLQAETIAVQAGPRPFEDDTVLSAVREAVKSLSTLVFRYEGGSTACTMWRRLAARAAGRRAFRCRTTPTKASASTRTTPKTSCCASCRPRLKAPFAGASMPTSRLSRSRTVP